MMMSNSNEKKWLVKSENKILGPYSFDQIQDLLLKKQISIIDEVRDTETRWLYLRENVNFKSVIDDLRSQLDSKGESTKTLQSISGTKPSDEHTQTKSNVNAFTDVSLTTQEASVVRETVDDVIHRVKREEAAEKLILGQSSRYIYKDDGAGKREVAFFSKNLMVATLILFILSISGVFSYYFYNKYNQQRIESELLTQVKKLKFLGLGQQAAVMYSRLSPSLQKKYLVEVIDLYPYLESLGFQLKSLEELENTANLSLEDKVSVYLSRFWIYMQVQNMEQAQNQIVKAKTLLPSDSLVLENEAILHLRTNKPALALEAFVKLYQQNNLGRYLVGASQCLLGLSPAERAKQVIVLGKLVDRHVATKFDFRKELLLVQMAFSLLGGNEVLFKLSWQQFLNTPTQLSAQFKRPALVAPNAYSWKELESYAGVVQKTLNPNDGVLLQIHSYLELSQPSTALDYLEKNKGLILDIPLRAQTYMLINSSLNKRSEVISTGRTNQIEKNSELTHLLIALAKVYSDPLADVKEHIDFFNLKKLNFYADWIVLASFVQRKSTPDIKAFLKSNYSGDTEFLLVQEGRSMID